MSERRNHHNTCPHGERCLCYITGYTDAEYNHGHVYESLEDKLTIAEKRVGFIDWLDALLSVAADVRIAADILRFEIAHSTPRKSASQYAIRDILAKLERADSQLSITLRQSQQSASN